MRINEIENRAMVSRSEVPMTKLFGIGMNLRTVWYVFMLFVLYGTLMPFEVCPDSECLKAQFQKIVWIPFNHPEGIRGSLRDIVQNILFFLPFGFLGFLVQYRQGLKRVIWVTLLGALLSFSVESLQLFAPNRLSSFEDITTNSIGSFLGASMAYLMSICFRGLLDSYLLKRQKHNPYFHLFIIVLGVSLFATLQPFDFTVRLETIKEDLGYLFLDFSGGTAFIDQVGFVFSQSFFIGFVAVLWLRSNQMRALVVWACLIALLLSISMELMQILIKSRVTTAIDILIAGIASILGVLCAAMSERKQASFWISGMIFLTALSVGIEALHPFVWLKYSNSIQWFPFLGYYDIPTFLAIADFVETLIKFFPLGFLFAVAKHGSKKSMMTALLITLLIALPLEIAQQWVEGRYSDITDVVAAMAGCLFGFMGGARWGAMKENSDLSITENRSNDYSESSYQNSSDVIDSTSRKNPLAKPY